MSQHEKRREPLPPHMKKLPDHSLAIIGLQALRDIAWQSAIKYRFDPVLSRAHNEYLTLIKVILEECQCNN